MSAITTLSSPTITRSERLALRASAALQAAVSRRIARRVAPPARAAAQILADADEYRRLASACAAIGLLPR